MNLKIESWKTILFWGSLWGILEATLGWGLHLIHFKGEAKKMQARAVGDCVRKALGLGQPSAADAAAALKAANTATGPDGKLDASKK